MTYRLRSRLTQCLTQFTALAWLLMASHNALGASYAANCASCHGVVPDMLSQSASYGKMVPRVDTGGLTGSCATTTDCALRLKIRGNLSMGSGTESGINNADMEAIRAYLVTVRDAVVVTGGGAFVNTAVGTESVANVNVTISNYRSLSTGYSLGISGGTDFSIVSQSAPSCGGSLTAGVAAGTVAATVSTAAATCNITLGVKFKPTTGGAGVRNATLNLTFADNGVDAVPLPRTVALAVTAYVQAPVFNVNSSTLAFAAVVGTPVSNAVTVTNTGDANLSLSSVVFSGVQAVDYAFAGTNQCTAGTTLTPSSGCQLAISFNPAAPGTRNAAVTLTHNAAGSPSVIALQGVATAAPQPAIALSTAAAAFGDVQLGSASSAAPITVCNNGSAPLTFSGLVWSGVAAVDYAQTYAQTGSCSTAAPLPTGVGCTGANTCTLGVSFTPSALGARSAVLAIQSNASNGVVNINASGNGVPIPAPQVALAPAVLDFGAQTVGGLYPARFVTLTNSGTASLALGAITANGGGFALAQSAPCPATLAPAAQCVVELRFAPTTATAYSGGLAVASNAAGSPHSVSLQGTGSAATVPVLVWQPAVNVLEFGNTLLGAPSATQSATLLNQGPGGVVLNLVNAVGVDASSYSVTLQGCTLGAPVFAGQSCQINAQFSPGSLGEKTAVVQVASSGSLPPTLALHGTGLGNSAAKLGLSSNALAFGDTRVGAQSLPQTVVLSSTGTQTVRVTGWQLSGPYSAQAQSCPAAPFNLPAGTECTVAVVFQPSAVGPNSGSLSVQTDATGAAPTASLSGNATAAPDVVGGSGGCSIAQGRRWVDPTLWLLVLAAAGVLVWRRERDGRDAR
jgi:trimeric autotransporter adhesin